MTGPARRVALDVTVVGVSWAVDATAWGLDRFADAADPVGRWLVEAADTARWFAQASRCRP